MTDQFQGLKQLPKQDQVLLIKEMLEAYLTDPALEMSSTNRICIKRENLGFLEWICKNDVEAINRDAVINYLVYTYTDFPSVTNTRHAFSCLRHFYYYTNKNGFHPDICRGLKLSFEKYKPKKTTKKIVFEEVTLDGDEVQNDK